MRDHDSHRLRSASAGALLGLAGLILVAAVLGGALAAIRANKTIDDLARDLHDARGQIDDLQADNGRLAAQNRQILEQNRVLIRQLRRHGLEIPQIAQQSSTGPPTSGGSVATGPKARPSRSPSTQGGQGHTGTPTPRPSTTPSPGALDPLCELAPALCSLA